ncbi:hypothetical protein E2P71_09285 [Candidatus Bathyarchaeota archaeon]|nr:hypothetical protein E2P71_09285 [Candidatus Bathyarchaeota archaeon]
MSEKQIVELGAKIVQKQIELAKIEGKDKIAESVNLESEIVDLKREFNLELQKLSKAKKVNIDVDE